MTRDDIDIRRIESALGVAARVVQIHGPLFLPVFERLEKEVARRRRQDKAMQRVEKAAARSRQMSLDLP